MPGTTDLFIFIYSFMIYLFIQSFIDERRLEVEQSSTRQYIFYYSG